METIAKLYTGNLYQALEGLRGGGFCTFDLISRGRSSGEIYITTHAEKLVFY
jgi:hypothetical protein